MPAETVEPEGVRDWLEWFLVPLLPSEWRIVPSFTGPETIDRTTVTITHTKITKYEPAPASENLMNDVTIRVSSPSGDTAKAENDLDADVLALVAVLNQSERLIWTEAEKVKPGERTNAVLAWDITTQIITKHSKE